MLNSRLASWRLSCPTRVKGCNPNYDVTLFLLFLFLCSGSTTTRTTSTSGRRSSTKTQRPSTTSPESVCSRINTYNNTKGSPDLVILFNPKASTAFTKTQRPNTTSPESVCNNNNTNNTKGFTQPFFCFESPRHPTTLLQRPKGQALLRRSRYAIILLLLIIITNFGAATHAYTHTHSFGFQAQSNDSAVQRPHGQRLLSLKVLCSY